MARKLSFKRGTIAARARSKVAEAVKRGGHVRNAFAIASATVKRMSRRARTKLAKRRG